MKEDKYANSLAKNQVCAIFHMRLRYSEKRFTQIYKALSGDAMFVTISGPAQIWPNMAAGDQQEHLFLSSLINA